MVFSNFLSPYLSPKKAKNTASRARSTVTGYLFYPLRLPLFLSLHIQKLRNLRLQSMDHHQRKHSFPAQFQGFTTALCD